MTIPSYKKKTLAIHTGKKPDPATGGRAYPIYMTTAYVFKDAEQAAPRTVQSHRRRQHLYAPHQSEQQFV